MKTISLSQILVLTIWRRESHRNEEQGRGIGGVLEVKYEEVKDEDNEGKCADEGNENGSILILKIK